MNKITLSIITPAFNASSFIAEAIESILNQTYTNFEYIILDDNSTDNTFDIARSYEKKDKRIKVYRNKHRLGIPQNRNKGISLATGRFVMWQDADDISHPKRAEKLVNFMDNNKEVGMCGTNVLFFDKKNQKGKRLYKTSDQELRNSIFLYSPISQPSAIVRTECFRVLGGFKSKWESAEDLEMSFRIGTKYKLANLNECLLKYRLHNKSTTYTHLIRTESNTLKIRKEYNKTKYYNMTLIDKIYNFIQLVTMYIMPPNFRIWLFNKIRNTK